jgi:predicted sugar kinase
VGIALVTTAKYLRRTTSAAANSSLGPTIKYLVNKNAGAGNNWAKAQVHKSRARIQVNLPAVV